MSKKVWIALVVAALATEGVFAQDTGISVGAGGFISEEPQNGADCTISTTQTMLGEIHAELPHSGGGGYAFIDALYVEFTFDVYMGGGTFNITTALPGKDEESRTFGMSLTYFNIGLLGKYPIEITEKLSIFPLFGIEYDICLSAKDEYGEEYKGMDEETKGAPGDLSALWFKFGGGLDLAFTKRLYLRVEALYGLRFSNEAEIDLMDIYEKKFAYLNGTDAQVFSEIVQGYGFTARAAIGYKF